MGYLPTDSPDLLFKTNSSGLVIAIVTPRGTTNLTGGAGSSYNSRTIAAAGASAVLVTDVNLRGNAAAGAQTFNLPTSGLSNGQPFTVKKVDLSINTITLNGGGILIDGNATAVILNQNDAITVTYDQVSNTYNIQ